MLISGGFLGLTGFLLACSSDDTVYPGPDGDAGTDQNSPQPDASNDNNVVDSGTDAPVFPDAGLTLENYSSKLAETLCKTLAGCCFGDATLGEDAGVDGGGTFQKQACIGFYTAVGFESASGEIPSDKSNLVLDNAKGNECIAKLTNLTCDTPGAMYTAVAKACFGAIVGKLAVGQACTKSVECVPGNFCTTNNGVAGTCQPLRGLDGNCGDWFSTDNPEVNAEFSEEACSYRGKGVDTGRYCDWYNFATNEYRPQSEWKCKLAGGVGANCASTPWCKDALCEDVITAACVASKQFFALTAPGSASGCGKFAKP
jgi:hypothetical protein